jgi:hypothetical protein
MTYSIWDSAIAAGATLKELEGIEKGRYSSKFLATLVAWHVTSMQINSHIEDAKAKKAAENR